MKNKTIYLEKKQFVYLQKLLLCFFVFSVCSVFINEIDAQQYYSDPYTICDNGSFNDVGIPLDCDNVNDLSPAEVIYHCAKENNINPVLLISKLQDEQSLITFTPNNLEWALMRATGYGMADDGDNPFYYGFYPQLVGCTYQFDKYRSEPDKYPTFEDAYRTYTTSLEAYNNFIYNIYPVYADAMNDIANTTFDNIPSSNGYYNDFRSEVTIENIQQLLDLFGGPLKNTELFSKNPEIKAKAFELSKRISHLYWPFPESSYHFNVGCSENSSCEWYNCSGSVLHTGGDILAFEYNYGCGDTGLDCGKPTIAPLSGKVIYARSHSKYGKQVIIQSDINPHFAYRVAHLQSIEPNIYKGAYVAVGDYLGTVGNSGTFTCKARCVLYKNIYDRYTIYQTALDRLKNGETLEGKDNRRFAAAFWFDAVNEADIVLPTTPIYPSQHSTTNSPVNFTWSDITEAGNYRIQVSTSPDSWTVNRGFTSLNIISSDMPINSPTGTSTQFVWDENIVYAPKVGTTYYWTVKTFYPYIGAIWSKPQSFTIKPNFTNPPYTLLSSNINDRDNTAYFYQPEFISLSPNPIEQNQDLNIEFNLLKESEQPVQIEIYNVNSEKIQSKKLTNLNIGNNKVKYQLGSIMPGMYICMITIENKQYTKRFVVLE